MRPLRGFTSAWFDNLIVILSVISFISLTSYIFDMTKLFHRFIRAVSEEAPNWSKRSLKQFKADSEEAKKPIGEWMLIHLIASRSDVVGKTHILPLHRMVHPVHFPNQLLGQLANPHWACSSHFHGRDLCLEWCLCSPALG